MVYCRMDGKETDSQRDEEHEAEIVDVDIQQVFRLDMRIVEGILLVDFIDDDFLITLICK